MPNQVYFDTWLLIICLSAIETLICQRDSELIGFTFFGFAQNTIHGFQNTVLNSQWHCLRQMLHPRIKLSGKLSYSDDLYPGLLNGYTIYRNVTKRRYIINGM